MKDNDVGNLINITYIHIYININIYIYIYIYDFSHSQRVFYDGYARCICPNIVYVAIWLSEFPTYNANCIKNNFFLRVQSCKTTGIQSKAQIQ